MTVAVKYPFAASKVRALKLGQSVRLTGKVYTGRDRLHKHLYEGGDCPVILKDSAVFHCGPVILRENGEWICRAVGPTTSARHEPYMPALIEKHGVRLVIGKGGMGPGTQKACQKFGCAYLQAVGGAAQVLCDSVKRVSGVHFRREFGNTEAMWELEVVDLPAIVTMDARGRSLHRKVRLSSKRILGKLLKNGRSFKG